MTRSRPEPRYLQLAGLLRAEIAAGRLGPGDKLPSETQMMLRHKVSRSVAKWAVSVLKADGLVDGRQGAGVFVRSTLRTVRQPQHGLCPGHVDPWTQQSEMIRADQAIAARLAVPFGQTVMRTSSRYLADDAPYAMVVSWKPVEQPRSGCAQDL